MSDKKISQLTALSAANLAPSTDVLAIVDTSATETKKIVAQDLINGVLNVASAVGIGTASPSSFGKLAVVGTSTGPLCAVRDEGTPTGNTFVVSSNANGSAIVVNSSGNVLFGKNISVGGETPTTSGTGITFPATQSASTNANTLDDYEEGTFTPVISGTTTAGTGTYNVQNGAYVKIGNLVQYQIYIILTAHTGTGNITITGLPFTAIANHYPPAAVYVDNLALTANNYPQIAVSTSSTTFLVRQVPVGGGAATAIPMDTQFDILLSGTYQV